MSRFKAGILTSAASTAGPPPPLPDLDPANFESDWTASLVAPPTGWTEITDDGQTYVYTATGAYGGEANDTVIDAWNHTIGRDASAMTIIIAYTINAWDNIQTSLQINDDLDGIGTFFGYNTTDNEGTFEMPLDRIGGWPDGSVCSYVIVTNADPTGLVVVAGTFFQDGSRAFYRFDDDGAVTVCSDTGVIPVNHSLPTASVVMQNYDFNNLIAGTPGDVRIRNTYIGYDEELDITEITAIVTGWGWT